MRGRFVTCADSCHLQRWNQAKFRGPAPPKGFARASILLSHEMLSDLQGLAEQAAIESMHTPPPNGLVTQQELVAVSDTASTEVRWSLDSQMTDIGKMCAVFLFREQFNPVNICILKVGCKLACSHCKLDPRTSSLSHVRKTIRAGTCGQFNHINKPYIAGEVYSGA